MEYLVLILSLAGLVGCYDIARRMSIHTRHGMRLAVIVIGIGCVAVMAGERDIALLLLLIGCGLYRVFDLRSEGWHGRTHATDAIRLHPVASQPTEHARREDESSAQASRTVGRLELVSAHRQGDDVRRVSA